MYNAGLCTRYEKNLAINFFYQLKVAEKSKFEE